MTITIEVLNPGMNAHGLLGVINSLYQQLSPGSPEITFSALTQTIRHGYLFVARLESGQVIGMATLTVSTKLQGKEGHVDDVVVDKPFRRQGFSRQLMERLIEHARSHHVTCLTLTSRPKRKEANELYPSLGFKRRNRETNLYRLVL